MNSGYKINKGLYLIIDPAKPIKVIEGLLLDTLDLPICAVQLWDNFNQIINADAIIQRTTEICRLYRKPLLINNRWEWLLKWPMDGVHFDAIPKDFNNIFQTINRPFLKGLTCNNTIEHVQWAQKNDFDYISFCSVYPSSTQNSCELVDLNLVLKVTSSFKIPVFLAGGITPRNLQRLSHIPYHGIAVVSGVTSHESPRQAVLEYLKCFNNLFL